MRRIWTLALFAAACVTDVVPEGLRATPAGDGPRVRFELARRDLPLPNDAAAFADPTSRTGVRPNLDATAATSLERGMREDFAAIEGWGVSSPMTVSFEAPLAIDGVTERMGHDEHDPSDDPIYVVDLATGIPALLELPSYERESGTLIARPLVPLREKAEYAVVLTDRLRGENGQAVRSPFAAIHHPTQRAGITRLRDWLTDRRLANYYGDIAGTGLDHVAFAWTFTTQPTHEDLRLLRDGLYGQGPFARWQSEYATDVTPVRLACSTTDIANGFPDLDPGSRAAFEASLANIDHIASGMLRSPSPIHVDFRTGEGNVTSHDVRWLLTLPKSPPPYPVVLWGDTTSEALLVAGDYAKQGIAVLAWDLPGRPPAAGCPAKSANAPPWNLQLARTRDTIRQGVLDGMNLVRALRAKAIDGAGGPDVSYFTTGIGIGGVTSSILGAIEPNIVAAAPIASGGRLADLVFRDAEEQLVGPFVQSEPGPEGSCPRSVRLGTNELACLTPAELGPGMTVVVANVASGEVRCGRAGENGAFRIPIPTSANDLLDVQVYTAPDAVASFERCDLRADAPVGRRIRDVIAQQDGLGLGRQSPELRRLRDLANAVLDPADPVAYGSLYMLAPRGEPHALLAAATPGDGVYPVATQLAFARSAGALPFLPPSAVERTPAYADHTTPPALYEQLGRKTPLDLLLENERGPAAGCEANDRVDGKLCTERPPPDSSVCRAAFFDPDWTSEGRFPSDPPHPTVPLRLARIAKVRATDPASLAATWEPRLRGVPFSADETGWTATERVVGLFFNYVAVDGGHGWTTGDTCRVWDYAAYGNALIARFFASGGRDVFYLSHPKSHVTLR
jgi:hypothetical protein